VIVDQPLVYAFTPQGVRECSGLALRRTCQTSPALGRWKKERINMNKLIQKTALLAKPVRREDRDRHQAPHLDHRCTGAGSGAGEGRIASGANR
jgi:hypothetical protein